MELSVKLAVKLTLVALFGIYLHIERTNAEPFSLTCDELYATGKWLKTNITVIDYGNYNVTADKLTITLINTTCDSYTDDGTYISMIVPFDRCGSSISEEGDWLVLSNEATVVTHFNTENIIMREVKHLYTMKCKVDRTKNITAAFGYNVTDRISNTFADTAIGSYDVRIAIYDSDMFKNPINDFLSVGSFQPIYIGIKEHMNNTNLKFVVERCFATPHASIQSTPAYNFFLDRCKVDPHFKTVSPMIAAGKEFNFVIKAFKFIEIKQSVFIHCELYVCNSTANTGKCRQHCASTNARERRSLDDIDSEGSSRGRRAASSEAGRGGVEGKEDIPLTKIAVSTNEIRFDKEMKTCSDLSCPANSKCLEMYPAICRCDEGYVLNSETKRCENERVFPVFGIHLDMPFVDAYLDPNSDQSIQLAKEAANAIMMKLKLQDKYQNVAGIKVIAFSPGSVVIDILVIYKETSTQKKAFDALVTTLTRPETDVIQPTETSTDKKKFNFKIKKEKIPTLVKPRIPGEQPIIPSITEREPSREVNYNTVILIAVIVPSAAIIFVALLIYKLKMNAMQRQREEQKEAHGFDNRGVTADVVVVRDRNM